MTWDMEKSPKRTRQTSLSNILVFVSKFCFRRILSELENTMGKNENDKEWHEEIHCIERKHLNFTCASLIDAPISFLMLFFIILFSLHVVYPNQPQCLLYYGQIAINAVAMCVAICIQCISAVFLRRIIENYQLRACETSFVCACA